MRIAKYWIIDCPTTNIDELVKSATAGFVKPAEVVLPNGLPRWLATTDTYKFFCSQERYRTWLEILLAAGIRIYQTADNNEIVTQAEFLKLKSVPPTCQACQKYTGEFPAFRDGRICVSTRFCRTDSSIVSRTDDHLRRFRPSPVDGVCEWHYIDRK
jgi:hypothetical protein